VCILQFYNGCITRQRISEKARKGKAITSLDPPRSFAVSEDAVNGDKKAEMNAFCGDAKGKRDHVRSAISLPPDMRIKPVAWRICTDMQRYCVLGVTLECKARKGNT
jgi:hypothetical protein